MKKLRALGTGGLVAAAWVGLVTFAAVFGPWLPFARRQNLDQVRQAPSWRHPLGTDARGLDMIGQVVDGARHSLQVAAVATVVGLALGATVGLVSGYRRGAVDRVTVVVLDVMAAFPPLVAALAAFFVFGRGPWRLAAVLGVLTAPAFARVTRALTLPLAEREFVLASRMVGASHGRVVRRELVPNVVVPVLAYGFVAVGIIVGVEGALSFFGAGLPEGYQSWGKLMAAGQEKIRQSPHLTVVPAGVLVVTVLALYALGERWQQHWLFGGVRLPRAKVASTRRRPTAAGPGRAVADVRQGLQIDDLHTWLLTPFGEVRAVSGVDLDVAPGEMVALVGESGSGKTMLARSVLGLVNAPVRADVPGRIVHAGVDLRTLDERALGRVRGRRIAMVFQDPMTSLDPVHRVDRQLIEPMRLHLGLSRAEARARAIDLLEAVGVPDPDRRLRAYPHELSGGLRQRVAIAIALSCDPDVLLADEPTSALDATVQAQLLDLLDELRRERRLAVLLITHDLGVVAGRADRVAVMYAGRLVESGPTAAVLRSPRMPYTRALLDAVPRVDAPSHQRLAAIGGAPPPFAGYEVGCAFAPRCARATDRCTAERPAWSADGDRMYACWYPLTGAEVAAG